MMYVVMDGFDLGIGILFPFIKGEKDRDVMMNTVAPVWDGNETWLVLGCAALFGAFPFSGWLQAYIEGGEFIGAAVFLECQECFVLPGQQHVTLTCEVRNKITRKSILTVEKMVFVNLGEDGLPAPHGRTEIKYVKDQFQDE